MKNMILLEEKIKEFLSEDLGFGDITTDTLIDDNSMAEAEIVFKEEGIVAGVEEAAIIFGLVDCKSQIIINDGERVKPQTIVLKIEGPSKNILKVERVALNILMRMSGIATATKRVVTLARNYNSKIRVAATRKTNPGFRYFDKKGVKIGGGDTHRLRLDDCVLIKNNHLKLMPSISEAVKRVLDVISFTKKVEIEVENTAQAIEAIEASMSAKEFRGYLKGAILKWANLAGATLYKSILQKTDFEGADLSRTNLSYADFSGANLKDTNLAEANLINAKLTGAVLRGADLSNANLSAANIDNTNFAEANLSDAKLKGATLRRADLSRAYNLTREQLNEACIDEKTKLTENLSSGLFPMCK